MGVAVLSAARFFGALLLGVALVLVPARSVSARAEETASFRTEGGPARVYLDGKYVGDTPLDLEVPCNEVTDRTYRIERDGCTPTTGMLNARLGAGRVVGGAFSLGISLLFQCPNYFVPVDVRQECSGVPANPPAAGENREPRRPLPVKPTTKTSRLTPAEIAARMQALDSLRARGAISAAEYDARRHRLQQQLED